MRDDTMQGGEARGGPVRQRRVPREDARDRDPAEIRQDIRRTRGEMDDTVDQLVSRFSVGSVVDELWDRVRHRSGSGPDVGGMLREHPVPIALMGLGLGWLAVEQASGRSVSTSGSTSGSRRSGGDFPGREAHSGQGNGESQDNGESDGEGFSDKVSEKASDAMDSVREKTDSMKESTKETGARARAGFQEMLAESPLTVGSIVFGLGLATGLAVPSSEFEDREMGGMSDQLKHEAGKIGSQAAERAGEVGRTAADAAISESRDQLDDLENHESGEARADDENESGAGDRDRGSGRAGF